MPFDSSSDGDPAVRRLSDLVTVQEGSIVSRMLLKTAGGSATLFAFGAGESLSEHTTPHDALVVVVNGTAVIAIDGSPHRLEPNDTLVLPANVPHAVRAESDLTMLLFMLRSDPGGGAA